jgi:hypothetical protein
MLSGKPKVIGSTIVAALLFFISLAGSFRKATGEAAKDITAATTDQDQVELSLTVYNGNLALIRDVRQVRLRPGVFSLRFEGVASSINPTTVHFRSLTAPAMLSVVEQDYEYDLLDPQKLLQKYVGREVTLVRPETSAGSTRWVETKALLLANNGGSVWKIGNEIVTGMGADSYRFPDLPDNLYSQPTLVWTLDNRGADSQRIEASYLAGSMNWNADYVLTVGRDEKAADLGGWVTLTNNSGVAYNNANLQLVAGQIHRTNLPVNGRVIAAALAGAADEAKQQLAQEAFSEYHLYTLGRRTSIQNNESKQISLLPATSVAVEKYLLVEGQPYYYRNPQGIGNAIPQPVQAYYRFKNEDKAGLGMPLPAGTIRVYQGDSQGDTQFVGEDNISHTPKGETLRIHVGDAFDAICERKQIDYKKLAPNLYEMENQISLRNHKTGPITVEIREPIGGDWEIVNSNYKATKLDAATIGFSIPVEKDGAATLDYRVQVKW